MIVLLSSFFPIQGKFRSPRATSDSLVISIVRSINPYALIARFADVTDRGESKKGEIERGFKIEISAGAENTFFKFGNIQVEVFGENKFAAFARKLSLGLL